MTGVPDQPAWIRIVEDEEAVAVLAARFASSVETPVVIYLRGDLGAGKTTFARAYVHSLGFSGHVKSPSYGLLETYDAGGQKILHLDLYRIEDPEELEYLAIRDLFDDESVLLVEWPDRGKHHLPGPDLALNFGENNEVRFVECQALSDRGRRVMEKVSHGQC
jgi:tRNA threonylcarbamoyladenosine biosynthesis protein TsaE